MATQEQVNTLQAALLVAEAAYRQAVIDVIDAASQEASLSNGLKQALSASGRASRRSIIAFHKLANALSIECGVTTESAGGDKDEN